MKLSEAVQKPSVRWAALLALMAGLTQFNTGLKLIYRKWTADEVAEAAKQKAEAVDERFQQYLAAQDANAKAQQAAADAIKGYIQQQQQMQQTPNLPAPRSSIHEWQDAHGDWWWCDEAQSDCRLDESWTRAP